MSPGRAVSGLLAAMLLALPACAMSGNDRPVADDGRVPAALSEGAAGIVRTAGGVPVSGAMIVARSLDTPARPVPEIAVLSGPDGRFAWPLRPGRYALTAVAGGRSGPPAAVTVPAGGVAGVSLVLGR